MDAIRVRQLRKNFLVQQSRPGLKGAILDLFRREYKQVSAVKGIDFDIPRGEICGYIGENGAGKSTTIKMLTGILVPTSGELLVNGFVPYKEREKFVRGIGVVFGQRSQLWWDIGVIESFQLLKKVYRVPESDFRTRLDELAERLHLGDLLQRPVRKLSLGQRMRCELAASLIHNPSILFLDEPTIGLDVMVKAEIREFLKDMNKRHQTTILLTTHDLQDIEALCSRVIMLDDGNIIYDGSLDELKTRWGKGREIVFQFAAPVRLDVLRGLTAGLDVEWKQENEYSAACFVPLEKTNVSDVLSRVVGAADIRDVKINEPNTDDIVREIYKAGTAENKRDGEVVAESAAPGNDDADSGDGDIPRGDHDEPGDGGNPGDRENRENGENGENRANNENREDRENRENQEQDNAVKSASGDSKQGVGSRA